MSRGRGCALQSNKIIKAAYAEVETHNNDTARNRKWAPIQTDRFSNRRKTNCIVRIDTESNRDMASTEEREDEISYDREGEINYNSI